MIRTPRFILTLLLMMALPAAALAADAPAESSTMMRDAYGSSLLIVDGDLVVGETSGFSNTGMVHVLRRNERGSWNVIQTLTSPQAAVNDRFGLVTAHKDGLLVVSSPGARERAGAVYAFTRSVDGMWELAGELMTDVAPGDGYGASLAFVGDRIAVGSPGSMNGEGRVHLFQSSAPFKEITALKADGDAEGARFGSSLATHGPHLMVGSPGANESRGRIDMLNADGSSAGTMMPSDEQGEARLGTGMHVSGNLLLASNPRASRGVGMVGVYRFEGGAWNHLTDLEGPGSGGPAFFGAAMASSDDEIWVSAPLSNSGAGAVYRYATDGFAPLGMIGNDVEGGRSQFGAAVVVGSGVGAIGMPGHDYGLGSAVVYEPEGDGWAKIAAYNRPVDDLPSLTGEEVRCEEGTANEFECLDVDMVSFISLTDLRMNRGVRLNDVWGWTDEATGNEYGLIGHMEGMVFVDVTDASNPIVLGEMPRTPGSPGSTWRDMKVFKDHAFVVADGAQQHGMQIFDLRRLRDWPGEFQVYEPDVLYTNIASSHNIVINEITGYAYAVGNSSGGETCGGALHMIDINEPQDPKFVGCFNDPKTGNNGSGATHDAQCVVYNGPDAEHTGKEICVGSNGTAISIADVSDKDNPIAISQGTYPNSAYVHQGWFTDDHRYFYQNDEADELNGAAEATRTMIWDLTDLDEPEMIAEYFGDTNSTDHNLYVKGDYMYQTNNASGLRIIDIRDRANPVEIGFFDTTPNNLNVAGFDGTWSSYPYFESGNILVNSRREGLFILKKRQLDL